MEKGLKVISSFLPINKNTIKEKVTPALRRSKCAQVLLLDINPYHS